MKTTELNQVVKAINSSLSTFNGLRSAIINQATDKHIVNNPLITILRKSKNDPSLYQSLVAVCEYSYTGEETETGFSISRKYTVRGILTAANHDKIDPVEVPAYEAENKTKALNKAINDVETARKSVELFTRLVDQATAEEVKAELIKKLESLKKGMQRKVAILEAVKSL